MSFKDVVRRQLEGMSITKMCGFYVYMYIIAVGDKPCLKIGMTKADDGLVDRAYNYTKDIDGADLSSFRMIKVFEFSVEGAQAAVERYFIILARRFLFMPGQSKTTEQYDLHQVSDDESMVQILECDSYPGAKKVYSIDNIGKVLEEYKTRYPMRNPTEEELEINPVKIEKHALKLLNNWNGRGIWDSNGHIGKRAERVLAILENRKFSSWEDYSSTYIYSLGEGMTNTKKQLKSYLMGKAEEELARRQGRVPGVIHKPKRKAPTATTKAKVVPRRFKPVSFKEKAIRQPAAVCGPIFVPHEETPAIMTHVALPDDDDF